MRRVTRDDPDFAENFWARVKIGEPHECWPWLKSKTVGYGRLGFDRKLHLAHRIAYELEVGPIPDGLHLDHTCHNNTGCIGGPTCPHRACCNPTHLEPVTFAVNIRRGNSPNRDKTHCVNGHAFTPENTGTQKGTGRTCRTCMRQHQANYRARKKEKS